MGRASRLRLALRARSRDTRNLLMTPRRESSGRIGMPTTSRGDGGGGAGVLWDVGADKTESAWAGINEEEFLLVGVDDTACAERALAAVRARLCRRG